MPACLGGRFYLVGLGATLRLFLGNPGFPRLAGGRIIASEGNGSDVCVRDLDGPRHLLRK